MIKGKCKTALDDYDVSNVTLFASVPNKGDNVAVNYKGKNTTLKVVAITHDLMNNTDGTRTPFIIVELHN